MKFISFWWNYKPIKCSNCGAKHKITIPGRLTFVSLTILPMLIMGIALGVFLLVSLTFSKPISFVYSVFIAITGLLLVAIGMGGETYC